MLYARKAITAVLLVLFMLAGGVSTAYAVAPTLATVVTDHSLSSKPKKPKNDSDCVANENLGEVADKYISRCRKGSIRSEFPSELLQTSLGDIKNGNSAAHKRAWKLLNDGRFKK
ncbi:MULTISPECIES: hypothetical protein [Nocardia]|jgi:hypothetical protein|uniref:hypothetical protein n=1 Tax=Nocardia TaxID=1817 RepID=UPI0024586625|nr:MULTISPECIES: hypothetical protein [Nocardia]